LRTACLTDSTFKSRFITAFGTYRGASVFILSTSDWNLSRSTPQAQIGFRIALCTSSSFSSDNCDFRAIIQYSLRSLRSSCFLFVDMCLRQVSFRSRYFTSSGLVSCLSFSWTWYGEIKTRFSQLLNCFGRRPITCLFTNKQVLGWQLYRQSVYCLTLLSEIVRGDQKVSVHLMITTQKVTSNVQCLPPVSRHLLTRRTVYSKTVFGIARSTFRNYFVMAIFSSSIVWGLFEFFVAPPRKKKFGRGDTRLTLTPSVILILTTLLW
jgi:hypothetical protein